MTQAAFQTARLHLRPVAPQDQTAVLAGLNDIAVSGWLAVVPYPYSAADFQQFQTRIAHPGSTFAVEDAAGFVGIVGLEKGSLGYWFAPHAHGKGYATEAARAVLMDRLIKSPRAISGYFEGNTRSQRVLEKLGFRESGRGLVYCRALGHDRPHVSMILGAKDFRAALPVEARSARLTFRSLQPVDQKALHRIISHVEVTRQLGPAWPWPPEPAFTAHRSRPFAGTGFVWGMFRRGALIGTVAVADGHLGYMLTPKAWGQGYASEACRVALAHAFAQGIDHVEAGVWADNLASQHVLAKLGFTVTGQTADTSAARGQPSPGLTLRLARSDWR